MASIFTRIVTGEIPSYRVAEDERFYAFLDISPVAKGHTLVIPKQEVDYIFDLDEDVLAGLVLFAKKVAIAIKEVVPCVKVGMTVLGLEVPHAHIHLIPLNNESDMTFGQPRNCEMTSEEMGQLAQVIAQAFDRI